MKKFSEILNEEYFDSIKGFSSKSTFEIFRNPSAKEILELSKFANEPSLQSGYTILLDLKNKYIYVTNRSILHLQLFAKLPFSSKKDYEDVLHFKQSKYITCHAESFSNGKFQNVVSDIFSADPSLFKNRLEVTKNIDKILNSNIKFFDKWFDTKNFINKLKGMRRYYNDGN